MKKILMALSIVALIGLVVLFALHFENVRQYITNLILGDGKYLEYEEEDETSSSIEGEIWIPEDHICQYGDWTLLQAPTHTQEGLETRSCYCGKTETQVVSCLGYDGLAYEVNDDGKTCTITGMGTFTGTDLVVGSYIDGYRVVTVFAEAFKNCTNLKSVTIASTVTVIDAKTFLECSSLESLTIPFIGTYKNDPGYKFFVEIFGGVDSIPTSLKSVTVTSITAVSSYAFKNCSTIERIILPDKVTSIGEEAFLGCSSLSSITISDRVENIGNSAFEECKSLSQIPLSHSLQRIGSFAFKNCSSLASVTVPNSVVQIGKEAFAGCTNLSTVTLSNSLRYIDSGMFSGCVMLDSIIIPNEVTSIESVAFFDCRNLTNITLPNNLINIGDFAFENCSKMKSITIPNSVTSICEGAFSNCSSLADITVPDNLELRESMFYGCDKLFQKENGVSYIGKWVIDCDETVTDVILRDGMIGIGEGAFSDCRDLISVEFSNSVKNIGCHAFAGCSSLASVTMSNQVTSIGNDAFSLCTALTTITLPNSVASIGDYAFVGCSNLVNLTIPNSVLNIGKNAFADCTQLFSEEEGIIYVDKWVIDCEDSLTSVILRSNTVGFANSAFENCKNLTSITIPNGFVSIGSDAFWECESLTSIVIPESVVSIGDRSFLGCSNLVSITLPEKLVSIGLSAFYGCSSLAEITIPDTVKSIGEYAFKGCDKLLQEDEGLFYVDRWLVDSDTVAPTLILRSNTVGIADSAFYSPYYFYKGLISITMPESIVGIGEYAFCHCENLTSITFNGTTEQWNTIEKGNGWNLYTSKITVHCTDGDITK